VIVTEAPIAPDVGDRLLMFGAANAEPAIEKKNEHKNNRSAGLHIFWIMTTLCY
jgi:hypothetical protein